VHLKNNALSPTIYTDDALYTFFTKSTGLLIRSPARSSPRVRSIILCSSPILLRITADTIPDFNLALRLEAVNSAPDRSSAR